MTSSGNIPPLQKGPDILPPGPWVQRVATHMRNRLGRIRPTGAITALNSLPALRELSWRTKRTYSKEREDSFISERTSNLEAAWGQIVGVVNVIECTACEAGKGPFARCVSVPGVPSFPVCANCHYRGLRGDPRYKGGPCAGAVAPPTPQQASPPAPGPSSLQPNDASSVPSADNVAGLPIDPALTTSSDPLTEPPSGSLDEKPLVLPPGRFVPLSTRPSPQTSTGSIFGPLGNLSVGPSNEPSAGPRRLMDIPLSQLLGSSLGQLLDVPASALLDIPLGRLMTQQVSAPSNDRPAAPATEAPLRAILTPSRDQDTHHRTENSSSSGLAARGTPNDQGIFRVSLDRAALNAARELVSIAAAQIVGGDMAAHFMNISLAAAITSLSVLDDLVNVFVTDDVTHSSDVFILSVDNHLQQIKYDLEAALVYQGTLSEVSGSMGGGPRILGRAHQDAVDAVLGVLDDAMWEARQEGDPLLE
ncbi:hypothetical protein N7541_001179 [Penicillium brevicompactum]|uniref:Uncharacterized protein n=1 Tax=Penicillium brevicompactum TaxID=5074 RepID=A0A9W9V379_PENBR|nr:hypothetical protein N7541_001179 [Penicillium brevicompactum]